MKLIFKIQIFVHWLEHPASSSVISFFVFQDFLSFLKTFFFQLQHNNSEPQTRSIRLIFYNTILGNF